MSLYDKFKEKLSKEQQQVLDRVKKIKFDECQKIIINEIEIDKLHSDIINICAYAFSESGPLSHTGYHFITVDPLYNYRIEKGNRIFDLLLFNKDEKRAILVECKSSIGNPSSVLSDSKDQIDNAIKHKKELEEEIGGYINDLEFVICSIPQDIEDLSKTLKEEPICLWSTDLYFFTLKLFNIKNSYDSKQTGDLIKKGQLHKSENLRKSLYKKITSTGQIDGFKVTPSSHICRIISRTLYRIIVEIMPTNNEKRFYIFQLERILKKELPKVQDIGIQRIAKLVYEKAKEIDIIDIHTSENDDNLYFTLKSNARSLTTIEKEIIGKYSKYKCNTKSCDDALNEYKESVKTSKGSLDYIFSKIDLYNNKNPEKD